MTMPTRFIDYRKGYFMIAEVKPAFPRAIGLGQWLEFNDLRDRGVLLNDIPPKLGISSSDARQAEDARTCTIKCATDYRPDPDFETCVKRCAKGERDP